MNIEDLIKEFEKELIHYGFIDNEGLSEDVKNEIRERINNDHSKCKNIEVSFYENLEGEIINVSLECEDCYETIIDSDLI